MTPTSPPLRPAVEQALSGPHAGAVMVLMNMMFVRHPLGVYSGFGGDLVAAIVLGEVAHHNLSAMMSGARTPRELSEALHAAVGAPQPAMLPTNVFSMAQSTRIPRETVRRKVESLTRRGWLVKDRAGNLFVTDVAGDAFAAFHVERMVDLLETARAIDTLLDDRPETTVPSRARRPPEST
jgi:hypothetical protein